MRIARKFRKPKAGLSPTALTDLSGIRRVYLAIFKGRILMRDLRSTFPIGFGIVLALVIALPALLSAAPKHYLWQTNSKGNDVHVISIPEHTVIKRVVVGAEPHGIATPADASVVFVSIEAFASPNGELIWIDPRTYEITHRIDIGPKPNHLACTLDGKWVYVPCHDEHYWVIDAEKREVVKKIKTGGRPHNTTISPNGRHMYLSPIGDPRRVIIVDVRNNHEVIGHIPFSDSVRPPAITSDGLRFFQNVDNLIGFEAASILKRKVVRRVEHTIPDEYKGKPSRCHGLAVRPDQKEIWSCNVEHKIVHVHDITKPDYPEIAAIQMIGRVYWLCFSPDSKYAYVAVRTNKKVAVVDTETKQIVTHVPVGDVPKRNLVITLDDTTAASQ